MSTLRTQGSTAVIEEHPWVSAPPAPSREERRHGLLAPVDVPVGGKHRPKLLYAGIAVSALVLIVVAQLGLSIGVSNGAYRISSLQLQQKQLARSYQAASEAAGRLSSPQNLAANANALGMVANGSPVYLRLSDGQVVGSPTPAGGSPAGSASLVPNAQLAGIPLVTAAGPSPSQVATDAVPPAPSQQNASQADPGTPAANAAPQQTGPVAWSGPLPSPDTH